MRHLMGQDGMPRVTWSLSSNNATHTHTYRPITDSLLTMTPVFKWVSELCIVFCWIVAYFLRNILCPCKTTVMLPTGQYPWCPFHCPNRHTPWGFSLKGLCPRGRCPVGLLISSIDCLMHAGRWEANWPLHWLLYSNNRRCDCVDVNTMWLVWAHQLLACRCVGLRHNCQLIFKISNV